MAVNVMYASMQLMNVCNMCKLLKILSLDYETIDSKI